MRRLTSRGWHQSQAQHNCRAVRTLQARRTHHLLYSLLIGITSASLSTANLAAQADSIITHSIDLEANRAFALVHGGFVGISMSLTSSTDLPDIATDRERGLVTGAPTAVPRRLPITGTYTLHARIREVDCDSTACIDFWMTYSPVSGGMGTAVTNDPDADTAVLWPLLERAASLTVGGRNIEPPSGLTGEPR